MSAGGSWDSMIRAELVELAEPAELAECCERPPASLACLDCPLADAVTARLQLDPKPAP